MGDIAGVGVDLVEVARLRALLERRPAAEERLFTPAERDYCRGFTDPAPRLAARFAAKEAVGKALGTGVIVFREIEVEGGGRRGRRCACTAPPPPPPAAWAYNGSRSL